MSTSTIHRIRRSLRGCTLKPSLNLIMFEEEFCLDLFGFLIALPFLDRWRRDPEEMMEKWGAYYMENSVCLCWGAKVKFIHMPWEWKHIKTEVLRPDGTWARRVQSYDVGEPDGRKIESFPYRYVLRNGEIQDRTATVYVERMEWRRKFLKWCPLFAKKRQSSYIEFSDEVGDGSGSWKGGCIGTGWDMKPGETPKQSLRRMERDRSFR